MEGLCQTTIFLSSSCSGPFNLVPMLLHNQLPSSDPAAGDLGGSK